MPRSRRIHALRTAAGSSAAVLCALALWPAAGTAASGPAKTLRFFSQPVSMTLTRADGTVVRRPPFPEARPGDVLEVNSLDFAGNHRHHTRRWTGSDHVRCTFSAAPDPDCESQAALGGSLLLFRGNALVNATGRFQGATGRVVVNEEVPGGSDIVVRIRLAR